MKNLLIIYKIIFLLAGNLLFSSVHHLEHHQDNHENSECLECLTIENSNNYIFDTSTVDFSNSNANLFTSKYFGIIGFNAKEIYLS